MAENCSVKYPALMLALCVVDGTLVLLCALCVSYV